MLKFLFILLLLTASLFIGAAVLSFGTTLLAPVVDSFNVPQLGYWESFWLVAAAHFVRAFLIDWSEK